jgi:hypothetical protein
MHGSMNVKFKRQNRYTQILDFIEERSKETSGAVKIL